MIQEQLEAAVARATGEPLAEIRCRGFSLLEPLDAMDFEQVDDGPQIVDWDDLATERLALFAVAGSDCRCR